MLGSCWAHLNFVDNWVCVDGELSSQRARGCDEKSCGNCSSLLSRVWTRAERLNSCDQCYHVVLTSIDCGGRRDPLTEDSSATQTVWSSFCLPPVCANWSLISSSHPMTQPNRRCFLRRASSCKWLKYVYGTEISANILHDVVVKEKKRMH